MFKVNSVAYNNNAYTKEAIEDAFKRIDDTKIWLSNEFPDKTGVYKRWFLKRRWWEGDYLMGEFVTAEELGVTAECIQKLTAEQAIDIVKEAKTAE